jgi:hypothetical protein
MRAAGAYPTCPTTFRLSLLPTLLQAQAVWSPGLLARPDAAHHLLPAVLPADAALAGLLLVRPVVGCYCLQSGALSAVTTDMPVDLKHGQVRTCPIHSQRLLPGVSTSHLSSYLRELLLHNGSVVFKVTQLRP